MTYNCNITLAVDTLQRQSVTIDGDMWQETSKFLIAPYASNRGTTYPDWPVTALNTAK